jgi:hypothetical protein
MAASSRLMIAEAERRFPVRIRIALPVGGFGERLNQMQSWLDQNAGADGWAMTPSGIRGARASLTSAGTDKRPGDRSGENRAPPPVSPQCPARANGGRKIHEATSARLRNCGFAVARARRRRCGRGARIRRREKSQINRRPCFLPPTRSKPGVRLYDR